MRDASCADCIACRLREGYAGGTQKNPPAQVVRCQSVRLVGAVGIEPTTFGLKGRCSTTELRPYGVKFLL